jgi:hypothetical protein
MITSRRATLQSSPMLSPRIFGRGGIRSFSPSRLDPLPAVRLPEPNKGSGAAHPHATRLSPGLVRRYLDSRCLRLYVDCYVSRAGGPHSMLGRFTLRICLFGARVSGQWPPAHCFKTRAGSEQVTTKRTLFSALMSMECRRVLLTHESGLEPFHEC